MRALSLVCMLAVLPAVAIAGEKSVFSQSLDDAVRIMMTEANPHAQAANDAFNAGDKPTGCAEARLAYDGYTSARQIFRTALKHYEGSKDEPDRAQIIGYLKENIASQTRHRLPYQLFLTAVCPAVTGLPAPVDSE